MRHDPMDDSAAKEERPTKAERNYGLVTTGIIAAVAVATAIYWIS